MVIRRLQYENLRAGKLTVHPFPEDHRLDRRIINGAPSVRETAGDRTDLDNGPLGLTEKRHEGLTEAMSKYRPLKSLLLLLEDTLHVP